MRRILIGVGCGLISLATLWQTTWAADTAVKLSNSWRIECSGAAHSDGTIQFELTPYQGIPQKITVTIKNGRAENAVAHDVRDAFRAQLPADKFKAEVDDGEDVLVTRKRGQPDFALILVQSNVEHVRLHLETE